ncbi:flavodoxin family protein [Natranaerobius trueperi]|uniref:NADPH-dependent FMN reductase-like domain-containing protein n=1 Tax=Natranaerobius trueperi TaxID=759412 RepID=A0A226C271_9FIRM|nr:flavodoxin family protein [Natranaerobius trueperi]OWZ84539.1 hypothetical protein CDO51_03300 [Natranaerobius trueperi]
MKSLILIGSPRKHGNSGIVANELQEKLSAHKNNIDCEKIWVADLDIRPCTACGYCDKVGKCIIKDEMQPLYTKVEEADIITFISPIYFGSITAQLKTFIDRFQPFYASKFLLNNPKIKKGSNKNVSLITISGMDRDYFFRNAQEIINIFCMNLNVDLGPTLHLKNIDYASEITEKPDQLNKVSELAQLLIQ